MKGSEIIAHILQKEYGKEDLTPYEDIKYEIQKFSDEISRVKIESISKRYFCCPVYAMFDGYNMSWYGDYGCFVFNCTWKTNVMNLAYESPYYQLEKLESGEHYEFNSEECQKNLLGLIKEGDWYNYDLTKEQKNRFDEFISDYYDDYIYSDDILYEHEDICESLKKLYKASGDEIEYIAAIRHHDLDESDFGNVFGYEEYELYGIGNKAPVRFFIILYLLSVVANMEKEKNDGKRML